jgi:hydrogenase nickel incorporation protein HypB
MAAARDNARRVHPRIAILEISAATGAGMETWLEWLAARRRTTPTVAPVASPASSAS